MTRSLNLIWGTKPKKTMHFVLHAFLMVLASCQSNEKVDWYETKSLSKTTIYLIYNGKDYKGSFCVDENANFIHSNDPALVPTDGLILWKKLRPNYSLFSGKSEIVLSKQSLIYIKIDGQHVEIPANQSILSKIGNDEFVGDQAEAFKTELSRISLK